MSTNGSKISRKPDGTLPLDGIPPSFVMLVPTLSASDSPTRIEIGPCDTVGFHLSSTGDRATLAYTGDNATKHQVDVPWATASRTAQFSIADTAGTEHSTMIVPVDAHWSMRHNPAGVEANDGTQLLPIGREGWKRKDSLRLCQWKGDPIITNS
jgi:hypothetical protein